MNEKHYTDCTDNVQSTYLLQHAHIHHGLELFAIKTVAAAAVPFWVTILKLSIFRSFHFARSEFVAFVCAPCELSGAHKEP
jgi:hypothetical protein